MDLEGNCLAWRTRSEVFVENGQGQKGSAITGNFLKVSASGNGEVFAVLEKLEEKEQPALRLSWFGRNAQPRGSHRLAWQTDDPLPHFCFNATATRLLIMDPAPARITILSGEGQVLRASEVFDDPQYVNERPLFLAASAEEFFLLTQALPATSQIAAKPFLICYTSEGQERWRQELSRGTGGGLSVSGDGRWILAGSYEVISSPAQVNSSLQLFDRDGKLHLTRAGLFRQAVFAQKGERVLVLDRRQARLLALPSGELLWQSNLSSRSEMFVTAAADAGCENIFALIATSAFKKDRFVFEKAHLVRFDSAGRRQHAAAIAEDLIEPALAVAHEGKQLALAAEGVLRYFSFNAGDSVTK